jgi:hypothetical protein
MFGLDRLPLVSVLASPQLFHASSLLRRLGSGGFADSMDLNRVMGMK